jgi:hypothetical protein
LFTLPSLAGMSQPVIDPTLTLQGTTDSADMYTNGANVTQKTGTFTFLYARTLALPDFFVPLIKWNFSGLPAGAILTGATLSLWNDAAGGAGDAVHTIHAILPANSAWTEADANWDWAVNGVTRWAGDAGGDGGADAGCCVAGTDYNAVSMGSLTLLAGQPVGTESAGALNVAQMQAMIAANYGMAIINTNTGVVASWRSSENATTIKRPRLVLDYYVPGGVAVWLAMGHP